jgi:hypothetical protein
MELLATGSLGLPMGRSPSLWVELGVLVQRAGVPPAPSRRLPVMDAGTAAIIGAVIGAMAGIGGAWLQARSTREAVREGD